MNWPTQPPLSSLGTVQIGSTPSSAHSTNWPVFNLGKICSVRRGTTITQNQAKLGAIPVVAGGLAATYFHDTPNRKSNVITVSASGASAGFVNYWKTPIFASDCSTVESESPDVCIKYVFHFLRGKQEYIYSKLRSGAAQPHVYAKDIAALNILLPPLPEQLRIAAILDQADALRAKRRETLAQLNSLTQSIFIEMFGDPATNTKGWHSTKLETIATKITDGEHQTPKRTESGIRLLSARNIRNGYLDFGDVDFIDTEEHQKISKRCNPEFGDILISCSGSIGRVAIIETDEPLGLVRSAALVKPNHQMVSSKYLETYLRTPYMNQMMLKMAHSSSQANLFQGPIRGLPVILPPVSLQREFTNKAASVQKLKASHYESCLELDALFASLQHRAFREEL